MVDWAEPRDENFLKLLERAVVVVTVVNDELGCSGVRVVYVRRLDVKPSEGTGGTDVKASCWVDDPLGMFVGAVGDGGLPAEITNGWVCV